MPTAVRRNEYAGKRGISDDHQSRSQAGTHCRRREKRFQTLPHRPGFSGRNEPPRHPSIKPHAVFSDFTACYIASGGEDRYLEFVHSGEIAGFIERFDNGEIVRPMAIAYRFEDREEKYPRGTAELRQDDEPEPE